MHSCQLLSILFLSILFVRTLTHTVRFVLFTENTCAAILGRIVYHPYVCLCWRLRRHIRNEMRKAEKLCRQPREVTMSHFPFSPFFHGPVIVLSALSSEFVGLLRIFGARKYIKLFSLINLSGVPMAFRCVVMVRSIGDSAFSYFRELKRFSITKEITFCFVISTKRAFAGAKMKLKCSLCGCIWGIIIVVPYHGEEEEGGGKGRIPYRFSVAMPAYSWRTEYSAENWVIM